MTSEDAKTDEQRIEAIVDLCMNLAAGDFKAKGFVSKRGDYLDAFVTALNMLGEELEVFAEGLNKAQAASINIMEDLERERRKLESSLKEREMLLREIHHRVKNNLQIIISLLRLQAKQVSDEPCLEALKDIRNRISVMSLVHEKLYRSENMAMIELRYYIRDLTKGLLEFSEAGGR